MAEAFGSVRVYTKDAQTPDAGRVKLLGGSGQKRVEFRNVLFVDVPNGFEVADLGMEVVDGGLLIQAAWSNQRFGLERWHQVGILSSSSSGFVIVAHEDDGEGVPRAEVAYMGDFDRVSYKTLLLKQDGRGIKGLVS